MMSLLDLFPTEAKQNPVRTPRTSERLPFNFPSEWVAKVRKRVTEIEEVKRLRPDVLKRVIDRWLDEIV